MLAGLWRGLEGLRAAESGCWEARVRQGGLQRRTECRQRGQAQALSPLAAPAVVGTAWWASAGPAPAPTRRSGGLGELDQVEDGRRGAGQPAAGSTRQQRRRRQQ